MINRYFFINKVLGSFPFRSMRDPKASLPKEILKNCYRFLRLHTGCPKVFGANSLLKSIRSAEYY